MQITFLYLMLYFQNHTIKVGERHLVLEDVIIQNKGGGLSVKYLS